MDSKDILVSVDHEIFQPFCDDDIIEIRVAVSLSREQWRQVYIAADGTATRVLSQAIMRRLETLNDEGELGGEYCYEDDEVAF